MSEIQALQTAGMKTVRLRRRRHGEIEAIRWSGSNPDALHAFAGRYFAEVPPEERRHSSDPTAFIVDCDTGRRVGLFAGDWVVRGGHGVYQLDAETVRADYERATAAEARSGADIVARLQAAAAEAAINAEDEAPGWDEAAKDLTDAVDLIGRLQDQADEAETYRARYRTAWHRARTRALSTGSAADRAISRTGELQTAVQDAFGSLLAMQIERDAALARVTELERPAVEAKRAEIRGSLTELISSAEEDHDAEGAAMCSARLDEHEKTWRDEDTAAGITPAS